MSLVAVLSDIHGVLPVLEAVLAEPEVRAADLIAVTGDRASGPQPREVLDRLVAEGDRVRLVRGNADRKLGVSLRHTVVDVDAAVGAVVAGSTYPQRQEWAEKYVRATNSDADAIAAFTQPGDRP